MKKPIIGILGAHMSNNGGPAPVPADYVNHAYCAGVENAGGIPILLPVLKDPADMDPVLLCAQNAKFFRIKYKNHF